ncbi:MAG TPA: phospholipid carrier-dependent glycosyltransferase [Candidatus Acidoferrales bacterium]|nr:phospholipid carrier-dependent glycosyltransferase [Candidatus Acidoferrales bacterium]
MSSAPARRLQFAFLILLFLTAFGFRLARLGHLSLAEDEAAKWEAIEQYRQGRFSGVNSEHPMLMKVEAWGSLDAGEAYNRWAMRHGRQPVAEEAWLRLPNVFLGAATAVVLYLLARQMLGPLGAGLAGFLCAISPLSVALNRVLKEETPYTFFTLLAFYLYFLAKLAPAEGKSKLWFTLAGVAFGLGMASEYLVIGQFGLIVLIWYAANRAGIPSRQMGPHFRRLVLVAGLIFVLCDPVILSPANLKAMTRYSEEKTLQHRGYLMDGRLYLNNALTTPYGLPWYYYLWVLAVKTPLPVLAAGAAGILLLFFERRSLISIFLRVTLTFWFLPYSLAGSKWIRYMLVLLPSFYLAAGWAVEKLSAWSRFRSRRAAWRVAVAGCVLALVVWPLVDTMSWSPYERLYLNVLGGGRNRVGQLFPPDEVYDLGVRDAARYVCRVAPPGARFATSDPMAMGFYAVLFRRKDLDIESLFDPDYKFRSGDFVLMQESRRYFETDGLIDLVRKIRRPARVERVDGLVTAEVYRF